MQKSAKTVIFGGTGFIGKHLARSLIASNQSVLVTGSQAEITEENLRGAKTAFYLTHIGSSGGAEVSELQLAEMLIKNKLALESAFQSVQKSVQNFIFISTGGAIYGKAVNAPFTEGTPLKPISAYGKVKKLQEEFLHSLAASAGVRYTILRPANVYGLGQKNNLIGTVIQHLLDHKKIQIFGSQGVVRDFLYIDDMIEALKILSSNEGEGHTFNLGTGIATPTLDLVQALSKIMNISSPKLEFVPLRTGDVPYNVLNSNEFQTRYGWKHNFDLAQGLLLTATQRT